MSQLHQPSEVSSGIDFRCHIAQLCIHFGTERVQLLVAAIDWRRSCAFFGSLLSQARQLLLEDEQADDDADELDSNLRKCKKPCNSLQGISILARCSGNSSQLAEGCLDRTKREGHIPVYHSSTEPDSSVFARQPLPYKSSSKGPYVCRSNFQS